jgi:sugar/nucleoside kinase (ribokinase family)
VGVFEAPDRWIDVEVRREETADATGAGDAFNAGYLAVRLGGGTVERALRAAVCCGSAVATSPGATSGFPWCLPELAPERESEGSGR